MAKSEEIDQELATGLKQAKNKRMFFVLVAKGAGDGALIVSKQKVSPAEIADAKKKCGGSAVIKGVCFGEDGKLVFEVAKEPAATMPNTLKLLAKRDAGVAIMPVCRIGTGDDIERDEETEQTGSQAEEPGRSSADSEAAYVKKVAEITPALKGVLGLNNQVSANAKDQFGKAQSLAKERKFDDAIAVLTSLAGDIKAAGSSSPGKPGPQGMEPADETGVASDQSAATYNKKVVAVTPALKEALARADSFAAHVKSEFSQINSQAQGGEYAPAIKRIDALAEGMKQVTAALAKSPGLAAWQSARTVAIAGLRELVGDFESSDHPEAPQAIIMLKSMIANLTAEPTTPKQIDSLQSYIETDDVVFDVCLMFDVKAPLLDALSKLRASLPG